MQKVALNLPQNGQNTRKQPKTQIQLKIAKIWPRHNLKHQNLPIRAPGQNPSWIPGYMPKKHAKLPEMP